MGCFGDVARQSLLMAGIGLVIPTSSNRRGTISCDFRVNKDRNFIERMFYKVKQFRRITTRYSKANASFAAFLNLAAVIRGYETVST